MKAKHGISIGSGCVDNIATYCTYMQNLSTAMHMHVIL